LGYCIDKYYPRLQLKDAIDTYYITAQRLLDKVINGTLDGIEIEPADYIKEFIQYLTDHDIKVGLVTSGVYEKAYPEIWSVCTKLEMGKPEDVYNSIITAGNPLREHQVGNLGELSAKPHPWLYLEEAIVGLNVNMNERKHVLGIEDSGAGICSLLASGIPAIGLAHGNIIKSGYGNFCIDICESLEDVLKKFFIPHLVNAIPSEL
jgi:phosphoglycolate phosphatase-like HAD superfamily hydrolase